MVAQRNLIILHRPKLQARSDFETVQRNMAMLAPDIAVHILSSSSPIPPNFWQFVEQRPCLIFSPQAVEISSQIRGARLVSKLLDKFQEVETLKGAGAPVPETVLIQPDTRLDEATWGEFTVVKPTRGKQGAGVRLMRTKDVRWTDTSQLPPDHPRHGKQLIAQRYINTGPRFVSCRVMTVLGHPIYSAISTAVELQPDPRTSTAFEMDVAANGVARKVTLNYDSEIIDLATSIHSKLTDLPSMGIDIIREHETGKLFALEFNSKGGFWHISSNFGLRQQRTHGIDYAAQFNALDTITLALIEATRKRAI